MRNDPYSIPGVSETAIDDEDGVAWFVNTTQLELIQFGCPFHRRYHPPTLPLPGKPRPSHVAVLSAVYAPEFGTTKWLHLSEVLGVIAWTENINLFDTAHRRQK